MVGSKVLALLWDADGVLQHTPPTTREDLDAMGGPGFADAVLATEQPALEGRQSFRDGLSTLIDSWNGLRPDVEEVLSIWFRAQVDQAAFSVVDDARAHVPCHLATNQHPERREFMRPNYDHRFDRLFYSCEMGAKKPHPEFFEQIVDELGVPAENLGFIDNRVQNVETASEVGIQVVLHDPDAGAAVLRKEVDALLRGGSTWLNLNPD